MLVPLLMMGYPILDTGIAIARRLNSIAPIGGTRRCRASTARNAHRVLLLDRGHLHHRLLEARREPSRRRAASLYACAIALAASALVLVVMNSVIVAILLATSLTILTVAFLALIIAMPTSLRRERDEDVAGVPRRRAVP